jgi:AcrR family transcriptional regulator
MEHKRDREGYLHGLLSSSSFEYTYSIAIFGCQAMSPRRYRSAVREAAANATHARIIAAARMLLGAPKGITGFSLDAVARKARITRLTVYNQFGSRRALLEAVFDDMAARGGLHRIQEAMAVTDPHEALRCIIAIFCAFWSSNTAAMARLHAATASDPEFEVSLRGRNERRRRILSDIVRRMAIGRAAQAASLRELTDILFALTSLAFFAQLMSGGHSAEAVCRAIQGLCDDAVRRAGLE